MSQLDFTDNSKFNLDVPIVSPIASPAQIEKEVAGYAAILTSQDSLTQYKTIMSEFEYTGKSSNLNSILNQLQVEKNSKLQKTVADVIQADDVSKEDKQKALLYYHQNKDVLPSLKDRFSLQAATTNPNANADLDAFVQGMSEKEQAIGDIQQEINKTGANLSGSALGAFGGLLLEVVPFLGAGYKGYQLSEIKQAVDGKDYGFLRSIWNGIMQGSAEKDIREAIKAIPTSEGKKAAISRILEVIKDLPGTDYNKYTALQASVEGDLENWEKNLYNVLGVFGAGVGIAVTGKAAGKIAKIKVTPSVNPDSLLGRSAAHNPSGASKLAGQAIVDESGDIAAGIGARQEQIVSDMLSKPESEVSHALNVEASADVKALLAPLDEAGKLTLANTERNALLYPKELMDNLSSGIKDIIATTKSAAVHLGKSEFNVDERGVFGKAVFGKTETDPFHSYQEALDAAKQLAPELPEGAITIVKPARGGGLRPAYSTTTTKGDHYLQFNYNKDVTAQDIILFGPDAVRIKFDMFGREWKSVSDLLTKVALSGGKVGNYLFAHHAMPQQAAAAAFSSFDKALAVEEPFITYARQFVAQQSKENRSMVNQLLKEGEDFAENGQLGKVFEYNEVIRKSLAKGLPQSEAEEVAKGYYVYRRIADWMYTIADRSKSKTLRQDGYKWITPVESGRVVGKVASKGEVEDALGLAPRMGVRGEPAISVEGAIRKIVDQKTGEVVNITRKEIDDMYAQGESLIRLAYSLKQGDTTVRFAKVGKGITEAEIEGGALPYIRGYVPRGYENNYFVVRTPNRLDLDGQTITDRSVLEQNRTTHAAADSMLDANRLMAKLQEADPTGVYSVKRERLSEKSVLEQADVFRQNMIHSSRRGAEALEGGKQIDPLVGMMSLVQSLSKKAAMEDFLEATKKDFVRQYGDFLAEKGVFPTGSDKIIAKTNMTVGESTKFKQARSVYNWLEGMMIMQRYDSSLWKDVMYGAGEFAEKFAPILGNILRGIGEHYPMDYLRKVSTAMFISLRPARQILLQPSQLMLYSSIDPKLINPVEGIKFFSKIGALGFAKFYKNGSKMGQMIPDELIIKVGARGFNQTEEEFKKTLEAFKESGLLQSVDSNMLVDGLYSQKHKKLVESVGETVGRHAESAVGYLPRLGRQLGFDRGEEINLAGSWLIARDRFIRMNPDVDVNSGFAKESISTTARELAFSMTRPGAFQYQKNALSTPLQFIAAPHKALLAFTTSKTLTAQEKARLMAAHFIVYGAAGVGLQKVVNDYLRPSLGDAIPEEFYLGLGGGIVDWGANSLANLMMDEEGEKTRINIAGSFSPLSGGVLPFGQFLDSLSEDPFAVTILGPSWNIVDPQKGRLTTAIRDISSIMRGDEDTSKKLKEIMYMASQVTSGGTDWMKYRMARDFDLLVASNGNIIDDRITATESLAKIFGIGTIREGVWYEELKKFSDEEKEIKNAVKYIYSGFAKVSPLYGKDPEAFDKYNKQVSAYMSTIQDPLLKRKMQEEFRKYSQQQLKSLGYNVTTQMYQGASEVSTEQLKAHFNTMESYGFKEQADTVRNMMGEE